ncbi:hypothetical protein, partial [Acetobacter oeni]|uniref:hypothetical protein n=1 Tax=Acetobacter oeni TaxID=304077 RepID=UPI001C9926BC
REYPAASFHQVLMKPPCHEPLMFTSVWFRPKDVQNREFRLCGVGICAEPGSERRPSAYSLIGE